MAVKEVPPYTVEQYLEMERQSQEKHEYLGGEVFAMAGASRAPGLGLGAGHPIKWLAALRRVRRSGVWQGARTVRCPLATASLDAVLGCHRR